MIVKPPGHLVATFNFFYAYLGRRSIVVLLASLMVALLDGLGLAMFLPLLHSTDAGNGGDGDFLTGLMRSIGFPTDLKAILLLMLGFFVFKGLARLVMEHYRIVLQQFFITSLRLQNLELLAGCSYAHFAGAHAGRIQNTLSGEISYVNQAYVNYFQMLQYLIMTIVYAALSIAANPGFALVVVVGGLISNFTFNYINARTRAASHELTRGTNAFQGLLIEGVASFKFLKATNLMSAYREKIQRSILAIEAQQRTIGLMNGIGSALREPLIVLVVVVAIFIYVGLLGKPLEILLLSLLFVYRGLTSVLAVQSCYTQYLSVSGSLENLQDYISELRNAQETDGGRIYQGFQREITVSDLSFGFGDRTVLEGVSFRLGKFETLAIVGGSGSGKTTLVNLLCGLLPAPARSILVDGVDITELQKAAYRDRVGYVTQEAQVFSDTVRNNVTFWNEGSDGSDAALSEALRMAQAADFVAALPDGVETRIGINGVNLSGGQRQRLSIARELYRKVDLLILDEATSALDSKSEYLIQESLESLSGKLTIIVIAHRLSTVRRADKIVYLQSGGNYEVGTFASLFDTSPGFREMVRLQAI